MLSTYERIDVLINNAGQVLQHREVTVDGHEATFAVNHLAPYLLTRLLLDRLLTSTPSRVVTVSSDAYRWGELDPDDLDWSKRKYKPLTAYGTSKLANALFSLELAKRTAAEGLTSNAVHPGFVSTSLGRDNAIANVFLKLARPFIRSPEKGARTSIHVASAPEGGQTTGAFWVDSKTITLEPKGRDENVAEWLWEVSADLVGLPR
jgi:NAD(P)-dependent dehydrogenase (short-subunit alcohol dehydrogenase family)